MGLLFQLQYPEIGIDIRPRHRFMSSFEQRVEEPDKHYQYVLFAAEPYETIAFKIQSREIDKDPAQLFSHWDPDLKRYTFQFLFKPDRVPHFRSRLAGASRGGGPGAPGRNQQPMANPLNPHQAPAIDPTFVTR
ncbi:CWF complex protein sap62 [Dimargaris xerosporica]|nr:CWF complex protein sap62 [Dimargaris xerosporica]